MHAVHTYHPPLYWKESVLLISPKGMDGWVKGPSVLINPSADRSACDAASQQFSHGEWTNTRWDDTRTWLPPSLSTLFFKQVAARQANKPTYHPLYLTYSSKVGRKDVGM